MWKRGWEKPDDVFALGCALVEATSVSCVDVAVRNKHDDSVNVARARKTLEATHTRTKLLEDVDFDDYDGEVWRWDGVSN